MSRWTSRTPWSGRSPVRLHVVDSHTGGEPTRVVIDPSDEVAADLGTRPVEARLERLRHHHDWLRRAVVNEPRGSDVQVGALLGPPSDPQHAAAVIFFNNVGYLGMCGHGLMGVVATLRHLGRLSPGRHRFETPAGTVAVELRADGAVAIDNVPARRTHRGVSFDVPGAGPVRGDVAYGGNWFFLVGEHGQTLTLDRVEELLTFTRAIRRILDVSGLCGDGGAPIDHVELFGPPVHPQADSRNFVLCPGGAYDRSPCGTGTSAKVACLAEDGDLAEGQVWTQESIVGSLFQASHRRDEEGRIIPTIAGEAFVNGEATLLLDPRDPFAAGIPGLAPPSS